MHQIGHGRQQKLQLRYRQFEVTSFDGSHFRQFRQCLVNFLKNAVN